MSGRRTLSGFKPASASRRLARHRARARRMQCMHPVARIHSDHQVVAVVVPEVPETTIDTTLDVRRALTVFRLCIGHAHTSPARRSELLSIRIEFRKVPLSVAVVKGVLDVASTCEAIGPGLPNSIFWPAGPSGPIQILNGVRECPRRPGYLPELWSRNGGDPRRTSKPLQIRRGCRFRARVLPLARPPPMLLQSRALHRKHLCSVVYSFSMTP